MSERYRITPRPDGSYMVEGDDGAAIVEAAAVIANKMIAERCEPRGEEAMSFEGYYRRLCKAGHLSSVDAYDCQPGDVCPRCGAAFAWQELVDQTNGEGVETPLEQVGNEVSLCPHCDGEGRVLVPRYAIPGVKP